MIAEMNTSLLTITPADYRKLSDYIQSNYGIQLPDSKQKMVEARLQKRIKTLQMSSFSEYLHFVFSEEGNQQEYFQMIDLITTNKTDFYREAAHFEFLTNEWLPKFVENKREGEPLKIWSSACSTGEEIYTLVMVLKDYMLANYQSFGYKILGTDLSLRALQTAAAGVYAHEKIEAIPMNIRKRYLLKNNNPTAPQVMVKPELKQNIQLKRFNLLKSYEGIQESFDIIFCRNVLIYFSKESQYQVVSELLKKLKPGGYLFIGHAESLTNFSLPIVQVKPTIYRKIN
ncbi:CheR family methyltransferase [Cytophagales bacterium LB-30]|uniref:protein-glutamate O-methyltransferase n=2 Tax=Shiella aurantiaca TaxID=3058365 RepID=A0ABT8F6R9_9BACT|nr:CheR family methyltransferase [Shiella aurantiaca]